MSRVTLNEVINSIREIIFDRFVVPSLAIKQSSVYSSLVVSRSASSITFSGESAEDKVYSFSEYPTMGELAEKFIEDGVVLAYTAYFRNQDSPLSLISQTYPISEDNFKLLKEYFFSDSNIISKIEDYYRKVLDIEGEEINDELVGKLHRPRERHLVLWVSYFLVETRRLYEIASRSITQTFTDGTDYSSSDDSGSTQNITVSIGSVFSISENTKDGYFYEDFNRIGSDNIFGDRYSFWYRLQVYIRQLLEDEFNDYSLRRDNVMMGQVYLNRDLDFRSYYDSYPFTVSPLTRGILSNNP